MMVDKIFRKDISIYFTLLIIVLGSTLILWLPFLTKSSSWLGLTIERPGFENVYKHYDGPLYIIPAKTLYDINQINNPEKGLIISLPLSDKYFAAHLPGYPLLIRVMREIGEGVLGELAYLKSMLMVNVFSTVGLAFFFYFFVKKLGLSKNPFVLAVVFLFLPRFLVVRSVGAPESLFMLFILCSLYFFEKQKYWYAGFFGALATITKTPGILLFISYCLIFFERVVIVPGSRVGARDDNKRARDDSSSVWNKINWRWMGIILIPLGLLLVFMLYGYQYKDFFAYFHSGDNIHLKYPFAMFNFTKQWIGTAWLEEIILYFFLYGLSVVYLFKNKYKSLFYFSLVFFTATLFVEHRDISRYSLALWPMACIAFEQFFTSKKFKLVLLLLIPAIYMYAWNFMVYNVMPIADWSPFL